LAYGTDDLPPQEPTLSAELVPIQHILQASAGPVAKLLFAREMPEQEYL
jgi:hypothetical protein